MSVAVLLAVDGARESAIAAACDEAAALRLERRCADLGEAVAAAEAGIGAVLVTSAHATLTREVVATLQAAGVGVVGVPDDAEESARMASLGIAERLDPSAPAREVVPLVERAASAGVRSAVARKGKAIRVTSTGQLIAVWGPTGAPGRTTLATALAYELAQLGPTILADADTYGPSVAVAMGLDGESAGMAALARAAQTGAIADDLVSRQVVSVAPGLRVVAGISRAERWPELAGSALEPVWDALRARARFVVVDCGFGLERDEELQYDTRAPQRNGATLAALAAADAVVAVGSAEPIGVQRLVHGLAQLDEVAPASHAPRWVVVNRLRFSVTGARPRQAVADALREYAGVPQVWTVPWDPHACDAAALAGQALGERAPRSAAARGIRAVAHDLAATLGDAAHARAGREGATLGDPARVGSPGGRASSTLRT